MSSRWLKLTVAYDGTAYAGWQVQPTLPTVQARSKPPGMRSRAKRSASPPPAAPTPASTRSARSSASPPNRRSRTPTSTAASTPCCPKTSPIVAVEDAPENFHATYDAKRKTYRYQIHNGRTPDVFSRHYVWHYPQPLDAEQMHAAAQALVGKHDFASFESAGSERPDSDPHAVRRRCDAHRTTQSPSKSPATASSTTWSAPSSARSSKWGRGAATSPGPAKSSPTCDRRIAGQTAPPHGLFLVRVEYI